MNYFNICLIFIVLFACAKKKDPAPDQLLDINVQQKFSEKAMIGQLGFLQKEFSYSCVDCHSNIEYVEGEGTNNIYQRDFLLKSFYQAKYPEENWIIKKISPGGDHPTTPICTSNTDAECEALILAWIHVFKEQRQISASEVRSINIDKSLVKAYISLEAAERIYLFNSYPKEIYTLEKILKGPLENYEIDLEFIWGAAIVSPSQTKLIKF